jgi:hypothetical protein
MMRRICFGHRIKPGASVVTFVDERNGWWVYKAEDVCVKCGKKFIHIFHVPAVGEVEHGKSE